MWHIVDIHYRGPPEYYPLCGLNSTRRANRLTRCKGAGWQCSALQCIGCTNTPLILPWATASLHLAACLKVIYFLHFFPVHLMTLLLPPDVILAYNCLRQRLFF